MRKNIVRVSPEFDLRRRLGVAGIFCFIAKKIKARGVMKALD